MELATTQLADLIRRSQEMEVDEFAGNLVDIQEMLLSLRLEQLLMSFFEFHDVIEMLINVTTNCIFLCN